MPDFYGRITALTDEGLATLDRELGKFLETPESPTINDALRRARLIFETREMLRSEVAPKWGYREREPMF